MNTASKILILCAVILVLATSVLIYMRQQFQPPKMFQNQTEAIQDLEQSAQKGWSDGELQAIINKLDITLDKQEVYFQDSLLIGAGDRQTELMQRIATYYCESLSSYCNRKVKTSWQNGDVEQIQVALSHLIDRCPNIDHSSNEDFQSIQDLLQELWSAIKNVQDITKGDFESLENSQYRIKEANTLKLNSYIQTNEMLRGQLNSFPQRLANKHYNYVARYIRQLSDCSLMSPEEWNERYNEALAVLTELGKHGENVYGVVIKTEGLDELLTEYYNTAYKYYQNQTEQE